ncbi:hypothetical protein [Roseibium aggregatum]|uniref:hypothetical protein n=1 Tax=Roseibium aggregatum TaxID=187304 RepID=UPI001A8F72D0|nr:hypothetical protein [Roseibium aggregatum]MBN8179975.1 hypothetical protein [Roseibium aggregatum]UES45857.1 hypothetical protein GFK90_19895 [Roseibium aggregatum]
MGEKSNWNFVDLFTLHQAACLWCDLNPAKIIELLEFQHPSEVVAAKQMLIGAITDGTLSLQGKLNSYSYINDYKDCYLRREDLKNFAETRGVRPMFLFDTLLSIDDSPGNSSSSKEEDKSQSPSGSPKEQTGPPRGRPPGYDWDRFTLEIIKRANSLDGLPETQAELVRDMLQWFSDQFGSEPAESSVKARISKIYRYLDKAKKS